MGSFRVARKGTLKGTLDGALKGTFTDPLRLRDLKGFL